MNITDYLADFGTWAYDRHGNILSWYIRPLFLLPLAFFAYRRSGWGIAGTLVALLTGGVWLARAVGLAAVVANVPHHLYHQANVSVLPSTADQVLQSLTLSAVTLAAIALAALAFRVPAEPATTARRTPAPSPPTHPARSRS